MDEVLEEHHVVHGLLGELKNMKPSDDRYDAKFTVLAENVRHHIKEEESEMFPKAEICEIDWDVLCSQVVKRKEQLIAKTGAVSKPSQDKASPPRRSKTDCHSLCKTGKPRDEPALGSPSKLVVKYVWSGL